MKERCIPEWRKRLTRSEIEGKLGSKVQKMRRASAIKILRLTFVVDFRRLGLPIPFINAPNADEFGTRDKARDNRSGSQLF